MDPGDGVKPGERLSIGITGARVEVAADLGACTVLGTQIGPGEGTCCGVSHPPSLAFRAMDLHPREGPFAPSTTGWLLLPLPRARRGLRVGVAHWQPPGLHPVPPPCPFPGLSLAMSPQSRGSHGLSTLPTWHWLFLHRISRILRYRLGRILSRHPVTEISPSPPCPEVSPPCPGAPAPHGRGHPGIATCLAPGFG